MRKPSLMTAEELLALALQDARTELLRGRLVVREPAGWRHGQVAARFLVAIDAHLERERAEAGLREKRGDVVAAETGFVLERDPDTVRAPDVAYVATGKLPVVPARGFAPFAPDLAVEVLSPDDRPGEVQEKVAAWLAAGTTVVWVVDPLRRSIRVCMRSVPDRVLGSDDTIDGGELLPGLRLPVAPLLA
jgi:Uma2 family endonuclease